MKASAARSVVASVTSSSGSHPPAEELLLAVAEVGRALGGDDRGRFAGALRVLDRRLGAARSALYFADTSRRALSVEATHGIDPEGLCARYGGGVAGRAAESGLAVVVPVLRHDPMALSELGDLAAWRDAGWNVVAVAATAGSRRVVLCAYFRHPDPEGYGERVRVLEVMASLVLRTSRTSPSIEPPASSRRALLPKLAPRAGHDLDRAGVPERAPFDYANLVGASPVMRQIYEQIGQVARTTATALVTGESGTGKELVARAIHDNSKRAPQPFVKVNCAALPDTLFESELFGHERGAFTGAHARRRGRFELAEGGTLFLDEIGELSTAVQAKLLRVLQFREFERLGGTETLRTDVRVVAATHNDLERAVREGRFREDLYYRINIFNIRLPSLAERRADVPGLAEHFLRTFAAEHGLRAARFATATLDALSSYAWPGNVRELENVVQRALVVCEGAVVQAHHLPPYVSSPPAHHDDDRAATNALDSSTRIAQASRSTLPRPPAERPSSASVTRGAAREAPAVRTLGEAVDDLERSMIGDALRVAGGNVTAAARALGTTERIVRYKANKLGLLPRARTDRARRRA